MAIGATLALWAVTALAILAGAKILNRVPARTVQRIAAGIFGLIFAVTTAISAIK